MTSIRCKLPNLIIAGVHKAGSTSLYTYLSKHPEICGSFTKEINHFTPLIYNRDIPELEKYAKFFEHCHGERFRMEASPSYIYGKAAIAQAIKEGLEDPRIIMILRDPVDRLVSLFNRAVSNSELPADLSLQEYVTISRQKQNSLERDVYSTAIREGIYIDFIRPWQETFGDDLKVVFFDDLTNDAYGLTSSICDWLKLDAGSFRSGDFTVENRTLHYRHKALHRYIHDYYLRNEAFWRKHHGLKRRLRHVYNFINAGRAKRRQTGDVATIEKLYEIFATHNQALRAFLEANNYKSLPPWLK